MPASTDQPCHNGRSPFHFRRYPLVLQVDIIISEWMGYALHYESMLPSVLLARDRSADEFSCARNCPHQRPVAIGRLMSAGHKSTGYGI
jgi:hypothetical protein